jgi:hypothetical protein
VSSKPTIERSAGRRSPRASAACIAPIASWSLKAKIALGGSASSSSAVAAARPPSTPMFDSITSSGSGDTPVAASAAA